MIDQSAGGRTPRVPLGRILLAVTPPLAGAVCLCFVVGFLAFASMSFWGERGPNYLGWAVPVGACWLAGCALWISGIRRRRRRRSWAGAALLLAVPTGGWVILRLVGWS